MTLNDQAQCKDRRLLRMIQHIVRDLTLQPRMVELARIAGLERTYLCRHFHQMMGVSFSTWNRQVRVERATELLANTDVPIKNIATAVGYTDVTTFERNFRRCLGCSPREYRRASNKPTKRTTTIADNSTTPADNLTRIAETAGD